MGNHKMMKRTKMIKLLVCLLALLCMATACVPAAQSQQNAENNSTSVKPTVSQPSSAATSEQPEKPVVKMMLPSSHQALGSLLGRLAEDQGIDLQVLLGANEPRYTLELAEALGGQEPPDLYWMAGEFSARVLETAGVSPYDLKGKVSPMALSALAGMSPEELRLISTDKVYGLPVGLYVQGSLVNLPVLAALLNCKDLQALQRDLVSCSYEEWRVMQQAIADYLEKPGRYQFPLGGGLYTMPSYRPAQAENLRGVWAISTVGTQSYAQNGLSAVFASGYVDPADYLASDPAQTNVILQSPLEALYQAIEWETRFMVNENGAIERGNTLPGEKEITADEAKDLFGKGRALFWKGDSRQALQLEQEYPILSDNLFIIPTKLPFADENVSLLNNLYGAGVDGYLCLSGEQAAGGAAGELLLLLFTSTEGIAAVENQLLLLPYTSVYPQHYLLAQLEQSIGVGDYYLLPLPQDRLNATQGKMADWINLSLMDKAEWEEVDKAAFLTAVQGMIGELNQQEEPQGDA